MSTSTSASSPASDPGPDPGPNPDRDTGAPTGVRIANEHLSLRVADLGAEMQSLQTAAGAEVLWQGDPSYWSGRAPILFPIVGRAPGDRIAVGAHQAEMKQHGFARRSRFALQDSTSDQCTHVLQDSAASRAVYPFAFALWVTHRLVGASLEVRVEIENRDSHVMPFGFGFHPAFAWPLPGGAGQPHRVQLDNGGEPALARLEEGLLPDSRLPSPFDAGQLTLAPDQFEADAMIFPTGAGAGLRYGVAGGPELRFAFDNLPNLALWTKPGAPFLCVEPWHGMAARVGAGPEIADRPGSLALAPGQRLGFGYRVTVAV